ncbi:MAG TPA: replicative DNA helicase [Acidothermaceae bacterium]
MSYQARGAAVSVIELPGSSSREVDRTPPQDINAEQSVLGGMMLSKDAIADVVEALHGTDFYRPAHQTIFDVVLDLYGRGEPVDAVTVAAELTKRGEIARIGGAPYLHTLISSVPTAANAGYYAKIVAERAILRRLVEAGTRIVQLGYSGVGNEVDDIVDRAQAAIYDVTERRQTEDYSILESLLQPTMDEIEASGHRGGGLTGVPTGFADLDSLTNGLHPGQLVVIAGRPAMGKALALDTPLPTPFGWTTMGEVVVGEWLMGADGRPTQVVAATDVLLERPCYEVEFDDGCVIVADAQHQWLTETRASRQSGIRTTQEIAETLRGATADTRPNHSVLTTLPLQLDEQRLPIGPYALGVWLCAGRSALARMTSDDAEISWHIEAEGLTLDEGLEQLDRIGVLHNKHIPTQYLRASELQRRALLAGLLDSEATVSPTGTVQITVMNAQLARDIHELVGSLGYRGGFTTRPVNGHTPASAYTTSFTPADNPFRLERKRLALKTRATQHTPRIGSRFIVHVRPIASVPVRCVEVDNAAHLYLAGRSMIPTHNSTLGLDIARAASIRANQTSVLFSLEMSKHEITMRLLSAESRIPLQTMRTGQMRDDDWVKLTRRLGEMASAPLYIDDSPNMTMMEIRSKARRLKQRNELRLVIVDYLQLMTSHSKVENRQQEVSQISRSLKLLAKELEVPVIALSQLNRGSEQRTDKRPQLSDLRESGAIEQDADVVILLHREDMYERESPRAGEADLIVAKHRNGPTSTIVVAFQGHYSRFVDMAAG